MTGRISSGYTACFDVVATRFTPGSPRNVRDRGGVPIGNTAGIESWLPSGGSAHDI